MTAHLLTLLTLFSILLPQPILLTQQTSQPVIIQVRDGAGNPLKGLVLLIKRSGPPLEDYDQCITDEQGQCPLNLPADSYTIQFVQGRRGRLFIPIEEQSIGSPNGFGLNVTYSDEVYVLAFVVGERDSQLVPMWDMVEQPDEPPQPFLRAMNPDDDPLEGIYLGILDPTLGADSAAGATAAPESEGEAAPTDVIDTVPVGGETAPTALPPTSAANDAAPATPAPGGLTTGQIVMGLVALLMLGIGAVGLFWLINGLRRRPRGRE